MSTTTMNASDLAQILFASPLQPSAHPTATQVRTAIACGGDRSASAARVAQEAGDHPEAYAARMRWALRTVTDVYSPSALIAA